MARLNLDVLGRSVQHKAFCGFDLSGNHNGAGFNTMQDNLAGFIGIIEAVVRADSGPGSVHHSEGHAGKGLIFGALHELPNYQRRGGRIVEVDGLRIIRIHHQRLRPGIGVDAVAGNRLQLCHHNGAGDAGEDDLAVAVGVVDAIRGHLPVFIIHDLPVGVLDLELHALQGGVIQRTQLIDNQITKRLVENLQGVSLVVLDFHGVGGIVQQVAGPRLDLPHNIAARFQIGQGNEAPLIRAVLAVGIANNRSVRPGDLENDVRQRLLRGGIHLLHQQPAQGHIGEAQNLGVRLADDNGLRSCVQQVAVNRLDLRHDVCVGVQLAEVNLAVFIGGIQAVGAGQAFIVGDQLAVCRLNFELDAREGFARHAVGFADQKAALGGIRNNHRLRVPVGPDDHVLAGFVHDIPCRGLDLRQHISAGGEVGNPNLAVAVRLENTALGQRGRANHSVQSHFAASSGCDPELRTREGLAGDAVPFLHDQFSGGLVFEGEADRPALLDLYRLALGINQKPCGGFCLGDNHTFSGLQAGNADFAIFICAVNAVGISNHAAVRISDLKLGVLEGDAGVDAANLSDKEQAVRGVVEGDSDNILHTVIGDIDRLGGFDDAIPICGIDLLHDVGPGFQPSPNSGAIFSGHLLPDDGAAGARGPAKKAELEGAAGQGLAGHAVILLDHDPVQRLVLEGEGLALAAVDDDLLRSGFFHLKTGSGGHLGHGVFAGIELLPLLMHLDFASRISKEIPVVNGAGSIRRLAVGSVGDVKFRTLDGSSSDRILLKDSQLRGLVVLEGDRLFVAGI